jgi:hypothetical protein
MSDMQGVHSNAVQQATAYLLPAKLCKQVSHCLCIAACGELHGGKVAEYLLQYYLGLCARHQHEIAQLRIGSANYMISTSTESASSSML